MKSNRKNKEIDEIGETISEIRRYIFAWIGIVMIGLCVIGIFLNTKTLSKMAMESLAMHENDDSNASSLLFQLEMYILNFGIWLKELPIVAKISGIILGIIIFISNPTEEL